MTIVVLVRHGDVPGIDPPTFRGRAELALSELGRQQVTDLATMLTTRWLVTAVYSSPLGRCVQTADAIAELAHLETIPLPGLNDIDYGKWTGRSHTEVGGQWANDYAIWNESPHLTHFRGGESLANVLSRATDALRAILHVHPSGPAVIVTHDSVIRVLLTHVLGVGLAHYRMFEASPAGVTVVKIRGSRVVVEAINETEHLRRGQTQHV